MKRQKRLSKVVSILLILALVVNLLPTQALALGSYGEPPDQVAFKVMRMDGVRTVKPISKYLYGTKVNDLYRPVDLNYSGSWVQLTYVIAKSQPVSLELYKLNSDFSISNPLILDYAQNADEMEEFLGDRIGYLHGIRVTDNVVPLEPGGDIYTDPQVGWKDIDRETWVSILNDAILEHTRPAETMKDIYAFGYQGEQFEGLDTAQADEAGDDEQEADGPAPVESEPPVEESQPPEEPPVEELPPVTDESTGDDQSSNNGQDGGDQPANDDQSTGDDQPGDNGQAIDGNQSADADQPSDDSQAIDVNQSADADQPGDDAQSIENGQSDDGGDLGDNGAPAENGQEPNDPNVDPEPVVTDNLTGIPDPEPTDTPEPEPTDTPEPEPTDSLDPEPTESPEPSKEPEVPAVEIGNEADVLGTDSSFFSDGVSDTNIQNFLLWDGSIVREEGGAPEKYEFEDGCYVIVMTPTTKQNAVYNSFLAFAVEGSGSNVDSFDSIDSYDELKKIRDELATPGDPVDLLTGSFTWNYTDFALYGENDLKFTRYYESVKADKNYGLGNGWTSNFTYSLEFGDLYAQVTLPQGTELFFDLDFDGSYANCGDYSLEWAGGSYVMKDKTGNQYRFTPDGQIQYIAYVNGDVASFTYSGDKLTSVSSDTGSFTFTYNGSGNLASVTDSVGRTVTLSYEGDLLTAAENPDGDSLRYTYDGNGYLATVANFKGDVYVENTYDGAGRVTHQYAADFGTFDFTYDFDGRHNVCTGTDGYLLEIYYSASPTMILTR